MILDLVLIVLVLILTLALLRFTAELRALSTNNARLEVILMRMERATVVVASDLAHSIQRADNASGPEGSAADAALRSPE